MTSELINLRALSLDGNPNKVSWNMKSIMFKALNQTFSQGMRVLFLINNQEDKKAANSKV
jgi:hypothetical protein